MMTYVFDADIGGTAGHRHLKEAGLLRVYTCEMFQAFDEACMELFTVVQPGDMVVLDTISSLAAQTRGDHKLGTDIHESVWDRSDLFFRDKMGQLGYDAAQQQIMRRIRNLRSISEDFVKGGHPPINMIVLAHQREVTDPVTGVKGSLGPDLNPAFNGALYAAASDIVRMDIQLEDRTDANGRVTVPADTRVMYLKRSNEMIAKNRCNVEVSSKLPSGITNPTFAKLAKVYGREPECLVVYAPGGVGKTTFALSKAEAQYRESKADTPTPTPTPTKKATK